jgi:hypothetical protein
MAVQVGVNSGVHVKDEVTWGTAVTPDRSFEFRSESIQLQRQLIESEGLRSGRRNLNRSDTYSQYNKGATGDVVVEWQNKGMAWWLKHMMGALAAPVNSPAGVYTHVGSIATTTGDAFTLQVVRDSMPFTYAGCKLSSWELACGLDELLVATFGIMAKAESTATGAVTAAYPTALRPMSFVHGALTVGGTPTDITSFSLSCDMNLPERWFFGATSKEPLDQGRTITGTFEGEFEDSLTIYNRFVNGTEAALVLTFESNVDILGASGNPYQLIITCPSVRYDGETPNVDGPEIIAQTTPFTVLNDDFTITVVNGDAAA